MPRVLAVAVLLTLVLALAALSVPQAESACCYFSAKDKDVLQPAQKAFLTWDPTEEVESFTVQPKFEGNAADFGMVIPTPSKPDLHEMPRDFFRHLAVFTILEPMDLSKFKPSRFPKSAGTGISDLRRGKDTGVKIVAEGIVGTLEYKVVEA